MVCQDGFFVSHITTDCELPDAGQVKEFLPPYKHPYPLDPRHPTPLAVVTDDGALCTPAARKYGSRVVLLHPQATGEQFRTILAA